MNENKIIALLLCIFLAPLGLHRFYLRNYHGIWYLSLFNSSMFLLWSSSLYLRRCALVLLLLFLFIYVKDIIFISLNKVKINNHLNIIWNFILFFPLSIIIYIIISYFLNIINYNFAGYFG